MDPKHTIDESLLIVQKITEDLENSACENCEEVYAQLQIYEYDYPFPHEPVKESQESRQSVDFAEGKKYLVRSGD